jgi:hypothetical protein
VSLRYTQLAQTLAFEDDIQWDAIGCWSLPGRRQIDDDASPHPDDEEPHDDASPAYDARQDDEAHVMAAALH